MQKNQARGSGEKPSYLIDLILIIFGFGDLGRKLLLEAGLFFDSLDSVGQLNHFKAQQTQTHWRPCP